MNLICDFDGTFFKNDFFEEQFFRQAIKNPFKIIKCFYRPNWLLQIKNDLMNNYQPDYDTSFLINHHLLQWINENGMLYEKKILVSASPDAFIKKMVQPLHLFDEIYGSIHENLKGKSKLRFIQQNIKGPFTYIGDSKDDKVIFDAAQQAFLIKRSKMVTVK